MGWLHVVISYWWGEKTALFVVKHASAEMLLCAAVLKFTVMLRSKGKP